MNIKKEQQPSLPYLNTTNILLCHLSQLVAYQVGKTHKCQMNSQMSFKVT